MRDEDVIEVERIEEYDGYIEQGEIRVRKETMYMLRDGRVMEGDTFYDDASLPQAVTEEVADEMWTAASINLAKHGVDIVRVTEG